jgi:hypothetical protein
MASKTLTILIIAALYLLASLCVLGYVLFKVHSEGQELTERVTLIADRNAKIQMYTELSRLVSETEGERAELSSYVLTENETSSFLTEIEKIGAQTGNELSTASLDVVEKGTDYDELHIKFNVEGTEASVKEMLHVFETLPYHSAVTSVLLTKESDDSFRGVINLTVSILSYVQ